jgi:succinate dehydrogenase / fumarate reductase cytochrome b subunit
MSDRTGTKPPDPGLEEIRAARRAPGVTPRKGFGPVAWFDVRRRGLGHFAFSLNRITALGLVFYLYLHLAVLSKLLGGASSWDGFLKIATTPVFLGLDVILVFGLLAHGLNGLRVALVGSGYAADKQRALYWSIMVIGTILLIGAALHIMGSR